MIFIKTQKYNVQLVFTNLTSLRQLKLLSNILQLMEERKTEHTLTS